MAVFGTLYRVVGNTTEKVYEGTQADYVMNYVFGVMCIVLFLVSTVLNPVVFWYHRQVKQTLSAGLFQLLTANDFLTCLLVTPLTAYALFSHDSPEEHGGVTTIQIILAVIKGAMFCWAASITATLGTVRCIAINFPFRQLNKTSVYGEVLGLLVFTVGVSTSTVLVVKPLRWNPFTQLVYDANNFHSPMAVGFAKYLLNVLVSLVAAVFAAYGLSKASKKTKSVTSTGSNKALHSAITIILMNSLIVVQVAFSISSVTTYFVDPDNLKAHGYLQFLQTPFSNTLLSALNPLITITRCSHIRKALMSRTSPKTSTTTRFTLTNSAS